MIGNSSLNTLHLLGQGIRSRRHSSYDTTGGNRDNWPIKAGQTVTLGQMSGGETDSFLYFYIDYHELDTLSADSGRFHACWRRELVTEAAEEKGPNANGNVQALNRTGRNNFEVLNVAGKGHYVGCVLHIDTDETGWWGEGDDMFFIDGAEWPPTLHGTGTEDYFLRDLEL